MKELTHLQLIVPQELSSTGNDTGVDTQDMMEAGYGRNFKAILDVGASTGTTPTLDVKIQESDALGSGYADISGAVFTQATDATQEEIHFVARKRYLRTVHTLGGTTPVFPTSCILIGTKRQP